MDKELHANCHKAQSCSGIKIATNLQELQEMPLYREYSISAKKSSTNSTSCNWNFMEDLKAADNYEIMADWGNYVAT